jgi:hypothetical protein
VTDKIVLALVKKPPKFDFNEFDEADQEELIRIRYLMYDILCDSYPIGLTGTEVINQLDRQFGLKVIKLKYAQRFKSPTFEQLLYQPFMHSHFVYEKRSESGERFYPVPSDANAEWLKNKERTASKPSSRNNTYRPPPKSFRGKPLNRPFNGFSGR